MAVKLQHDDGLSDLVAAYVVARDEAGADPPEGDYTEGGFTDFDYFLTSDLSGPEILEIGMSIAQDAAGRPAWWTYDGVEYRVFFGELEDVKRRVRDFMTVLEVLEA